MNFVGDDVVRKRVSKHKAEFDKLRKSIRKIQQEAAKKNVYGRDDSIVSKILYSFDTFECRKWKIWRRRIAIRSKNDSFFKTEDNLKMPSKLDTNAKRWPKTSSLT